MARSARVSLLQLQAFSVDEAGASLAHTLARIDVAARERPDIIALPEVTYPGYFIGAPQRPAGVLSSEDTLTVFAEKAREHNAYVAAGLALDDDDGHMVNAAALFDRDGRLMGRYDKCFLWHFDSQWFRAGAEFPVFETDVGRIGMLICADGRLPEIARCLTLNGAQLILDLTAWVSTGRRPSDLTTTQRQYLMQTRAAENGVWIACADKHGIEAESLVYAGRSCVISPEGQYAAELGPDEEGILTFDVPVGDAAPPIMRRPELYGALTQPTESLPAVHNLDEPFVMREHERRAAAVQIAMPSTWQEFLARAREHTERLMKMDAHVVVFPAVPGRLRRGYHHDQTLDGVLAIARDTGCLLAFSVSEGPDASGRRAMYVVGPRGVVATHDQTHKPPGEKFATMPLGDTVSPVFNTPLGRTGLMLGAEGMVPEVARSLMLRGAEVILWSGDSASAPMSMFARTRSDENRVFVVMAAAPTENGGALITDAAGGIQQAALIGREHSISATVNRALAHLKARAPGTDVLLDRQPASYNVITRPLPIPETVV